MERLDSPADVEKLNYKFFINDCYLTQFVDYTDSKGIYRKFRLVCIEGELFIRHVLYSDRWMIRANARNQFMKKNSWYFDTEKTVIEQFRTDMKIEIEPAVKQISGAVGLDYFGIDCAIDDGFKLVIFKISPNMDILHSHSQLPGIRASLVDDIRQRLISMITRRSAPG
jgi:hypothetical protein